MLVVRLPKINPLPPINFAQVLAANQDDVGPEVIDAVAALDAAVSRVDLGRGWVGRMAGELPSQASLLAACLR